jgi:hypothetical protein
MVAAEVFLEVVVVWAQTSCKTEVELILPVGTELAGMEVDIDNSNCPPGNCEGSAEYHAPNAQE